MAVRTWIIAAGASSAALLLGALGFQFLAGLTPCPLCIWQRWPHVAAVLIAGLIVVLAWRRLRPLALLGTLAMLVNAGLATYHTGIERGWWRGPDTCSAGDIRSLTTDQLMNQILGAPLVRCDEVTWELLGLSMASWNGLASLALAALWLAAALAPGRYDSSSASQ